MKLSETVTRWFGRVEVVIAGAENALRDAEEALAVGDAMRARSAAHALLNKLPKSPIGLALLADACELGGLDAELAMTLEELAQRVGSRADIWLRLGRARQKTEAPQEDVRDAWLRGLAVAEAGSEVRKETLLALADLDLAIGDGARADLWLDRLADDKANEAGLRRAEARLAEGDYQGAERWLTGFEGEIAHVARGAGHRPRPLRGPRRRCLPCPPPGDAAGRAGSERGSLVGARLSRLRRGHARAHPHGGGGQGRRASAPLACRLCARRRPPRPAPPSPTR